MVAIDKIPPGPGQESVWDYPRPPIVELSKKPIRVLLNGIVVAEADSSLRVLETSHAPAYYVHPDSINWDYIRKSTKTTFCEFKGLAAHYTVEVTDLKVVNGAWYYPIPSPSFAEIKNYVAFYPGKFDCYLDGERAKPQYGDFYGGWITSDVVGPFKGEPGTLHW